MTRWPGVKVEKGRRVTAYVKLVGWKVTEQNSNQSNRKRARYHEMGKSSGIVQGPQVLVPDHGCVCVAQWYASTSS